MVIKALINRCLVMAWCSKHFQYKNYAYNAMQCIENAATIQVKLPFDFTRVVKIFLATME
jgi:hypothetical protein